MQKSVTRYVLIMSSWSSHTSRSWLCHPIASYTFFSSCSDMVWEESDVSQIIWFSGKDSSLQEAVLIPIGNGTSPIHVLDCMVRMVKALCCQNIQIRRLIFLRMLLATSSRQSGVSISSWSASSSISPVATEHACFFSVSYVFAFSSNATAFIPMILLSLILFWFCCSIIKQYNCPSLGAFFFMFV